MVNTFFVLQAEGRSYSVAVLQCNGLSARRAVSNGDLVAD